MTNRSSSETVLYPSGLVIPDSVRAVDQFVIFNDIPDFRVLNDVNLCPPEDVANENIRPEEIGMAHYELTTGDIELAGPFMPQFARFFGLSIMGIYLSYKKETKVGDKHLVIGDEDLETAKFCDQIAKLGASALGHELPEAKSSYKIVYLKPNTPQAR